MTRVGSTTLAVTAVTFGATSTAVAVVSAAALAAAAAVTDLDPGLVMALGHLHTTTLLCAAHPHGTARSPGSDRGGGRPGAPRQYPVEQVALATP